MKPTSKEGNYIVECNTITETNNVLSYILDSNEEHVAFHWRFVRKEDKIWDIDDELNTEENQLPVIPYEEWIALPECDPKKEEEKNTNPYGIKNSDAQVENTKIEIQEKPKIIGYKLVKSEYLYATNVILKKNNINDTSLLRQEFFIDSDFYHKLKEAGVLDLWFEPVYEEENIYQELFNYMSDQHDLTLLESDMQEIVNIVNRMQKQA